MNKSIFYASGPMGSIIQKPNRFQIDRVYSQELQSRLKNIANLNTDEVYNKKALLENPSLTKDTEYVFSTWGCEAMTEEEIDLCFPSLKCLFYAAGTVQGFARPFLNKGIRVFSAWAANAVPVAEYTLSQILLANKGFYRSLKVYNDLKDVVAARQEIYQYAGNYGCKVGIIGAGMIGKIVIELLKPFNLEILVFDPFLPDSKAVELGVEKCSLEKIFSECSTISNHLANNDETVGILNYALFSLMKNRTTFINTGRGAQVVEEDLIRALKEDPTRTAVLDVTFPEPPAVNSELFTLPNIFLTPHIAGSFGDEVHRLSEYMEDEFLRVRENTSVLYEVTEEMLKTMA